MDKMIKMFREVLWLVVITPRKYEMRALIVHNFDLVVDHPVLSL